jgi:hypothetical protein
VSQVERLVSATVVPQPYTTAAFVETVGQARGKPIELVAAHRLPRGCGMLLVTEQVDYIFYTGASPLHCDHNVLHELGHLLLGHPLVDLHDVAALAVRFPDLSPALIRRMVGPVRFDQEQEDDADLFARLVVTSATATAPAGGDPVPGLGAAFASPVRRARHSRPWMLHPWLAGREVGTA